MSESLFAECVLPGCRELVTVAGEVGPQCLAAFGDLLRPVPAAQSLTVEQIHGRDQAVSDQLRARRALAAEDGRTGKPNQLCWLCEQRRLCVRAAHGWECRDCQQVT